MFTLVQLVVLCNLWIRGDRHGFTCVGLVVLRLLVDLAGVVFLYRLRHFIIAMFTTRHLAEVPENPGRGIEGAQASTEQQPIVRLSSILGAV